MNGSTITEAIRTRHIISFYYDGGTRMVEPYCYGTSTAGHKVLRGYQTSGYTSSGKRGWKLFEVSKMSNLQVTDETFASNRRGYKPNDSAMSSVIAHV